MKGGELMTDNVVEITESTPEKMVHAIMELLSLKLINQLNGAVEWDDPKARLLFLKYALDDAIEKNKSLLDKTTSCVSNLNSIGADEYIYTLDVVFNILPHHVVKLTIRMNGNGKPTSASYTMDGLL